MQINLTINKGTIMFLIGLVLITASLSTAALGRQTKTPKASSSGWQYKLIDFHGDAQTSDKWEPIGFIPQSGNEWAKVFVRKPIN